MDFLSEEDKNDMQNETFTNAYPTADDEADIERDLEDWVEEGEAMKSLFNEDRLDTVSSLISHDLDLFGFDLRSVVREYCSDDDLSVIKLINFIRSNVAKQPVELINAEFISNLVQSIGTKEFIQNDEYMKPVIEDDPLLFLYEEELLPHAADSP